MSSNEIQDSDLKPTTTAGFQLTEQHSLDHYNTLDAEDESLNKWKASLGLGTATTPHDGPKVTVLSLSLHSPTLETPIVLETNDLDRFDFKEAPIVIKEGVNYALELAFKVGGGVVTGLKFIQVVKRAGITFDKLEKMIGSYGPSATPIVRRFDEEESPSGVIARTGTYAARSRVVDDDGVVYLDLEWTFKLAKTW